MDIICRMAAKEWLLSACMHVLVSGKYAMHVCEWAERAWSSKWIFFYCGGWTALSIHVRPCDVYLYEMHVRMRVVCYIHTYSILIYIYVYVLRIAMIVGAHGWCIMKSIRRAVCYCSSDCLVNGKIDNFVRSCIKICNVLEWRCRRATTYTFTQMSWNRPCGFRLFVFGSLNLPNMHSMSMIRAHHKHNGHTMNRSIHLYDDFTLTLLPSPSIPFIVVVVFGH